MIRLLPLWHRIKFSPRSVPFALLGACILAYGLLIPWLGFYWDDWPAIWFLHFLGPSGFSEVFASDRPLLGHLFRITTTVFSESTIVWQIFGFTTHWLAAVCFWGLLRCLHPGAEKPALWASLIFALYPGFSQQFIAVTYSHVFLLQASFIGSLWVMLAAFRRPNHKYRLLFLGWILAAGTHFTVEYFFGLELLRPALLWVVQNPEVPRLRERIKKIVYTWVPYLVIMVGFLAWRLVFTDTPRGQVQLTTKFLNQPGLTLLDLMIEILQDAWQSGLYAWLRIFDLRRLNDFGTWPAATFWLVTLISLILALIYLLRFSPIKQDPNFRMPDMRKLTITYILLGAAGLFIGGLPFWTTNLPIELYFPWDRFTLAMILPSSILIIGLISLIPIHNLLRSVLLSSLIAFTIGYQYWNANQYRREWNEQEAFFWQLVWRAPHIKPGTLILASELPFTHFSDNSLSAPLNWIYSPDELSNPMPYMLYNLEGRLGRNIPDLKPDLVVSDDYRAVQFIGTTSDVLVLYYQPPGCLKIVSSKNDARVPQKPKYIADAMPLSILDRIEPFPSSPASPPRHIFGPEPQADWCYYFEHAELARQTGDHEAVVGYAEQALSLNTRLYEVNAPELLPYIAGYAHLGDWSMAANLSIEALNLSDRMRNSLCHLWFDLITATPGSMSQQTTWNELNQELKCNDQ